MTGDIKMGVIKLKTKQATKQQLFDTWGCILQSTIIIIIAFIIIIIIVQTAIQIYSAVLHNITNELTELSKNQFENYVTINRLKG